MPEPPSDKRWWPVRGVEVGYQATPIAGPRGDLPLMLSVGQGIGYFDAEEFRAIIAAMEEAMREAEESGH